MKKLIALILALTLAVPGVAAAESADTNKDKTVRIWPLPLDIKTISMGSGFFVEGGRIVTNDHILHGATSFLIKDGAGHEYTADIVASDSDNDLAILSTPEKDHPHFELADDVSPGQKVSFIGSDIMDAYRQWDTVITQASTFVSVGPDYSGDRMLLAQDGMHGYSGGPVINSDSEVVGVMEAGSVGLGSAAVHVSDLTAFLADYPAPKIVKSRLEQIRDRFKGVLKRDNAGE